MLPTARCSFVFGDIRNLNILHTVLSSETLQQEEYNQPPTIIIVVYRGLHHY